MSKITDMLISSILKKGILGEFKNFESELKIPQENGSINIIFKAENLQIKVEKEN